MKKRYLSVVAVCAAGLAVILTGCVRTEWEGSFAGGAVIEAEGLVTLEEEKYILNVDKLPEENMNEEQIAAYKANVTADFIFENSGKEDAAVSVKYPLSDSPEYFKGEYEPATAYGFTVNGRAAAYETRHIYRYRDGTKESDGFFTAQLPVSVCVYEVSCAETEIFKKYTASVQYDRLRTRILCSSCSYSYGELTVEGRSGGRFIFYVFGDEIPAFSWRTEGEGKLVLCFTEKTVFGDLVETGRPLEIGKEDWLVGTAEMLEAKSTEYGFTRACPLIPDPSDFDRFLCATVAVPAGGRTECVIDAPLFPTLFQNGSCDVTLLPALFSESDTVTRHLNVEVVTPYALSSSSLFSQTKNGYAYGGEYQTEMFFSLEETEEQKEAQEEADRLNNQRRTLRFFGLFMALGLLVPSAIALAIILPFVLKRKK